MRISPGMARHDFGKGTTSVVPPLKMRCALGPEVRYSGSIGMSVVRRFKRDKQNRRG